VTSSTGLLTGLVVAELVGLGLSVLLGALLASARCRRW
jgi:hypothetical protein